MKGRWLLLSHVLKGTATAATLGSAVPDKAATGRAAGTAAAGMPARGNAWSERDAQAKGIPTPGSPAPCSPAPGKAAPAAGPLFPMVDNRFICGDAGCTASETPPAGSTNGAVHHYTRILWTFIRTLSRGPCACRLSGRKCRRSAPAGWAYFARRCRWGWPAYSSSCPSWEDRHFPLHHNPWRQGQRVCWS